MKPDPSYPADEADYLDWLDEQPCAFCYEQNKHCVCRELDELWEGFVLPDDQESW